MNLTQVLDTMTAIRSFYVLLEIDVKIKETPGCSMNISRDFNSYAEKLAKTFFDYSALICMGEARHGINKSTRTISQFSKYDYVPDRNYIYNMADMVDPIKSNAAIYDVFNSLWITSSYGGPKWREVAECYPLYMDLSPIMFIDMIVNKQHNGGYIFTKPALCKDVGGSCLKKFLDYRSTSNATSYRYIQHMELYGFVIDIMCKAAEIGLIEGPITNVSSRPIRFPAPLEWGYIGLTSQDNPLYPYCDHCGGYYGVNCNCNICKKCGNYKGSCTCSNNSTEEVNLNEIYGTYAVTKNYSKFSRA